MGLGLAAAHAWLLMDLAVYGAIRLDHPIRGWRPDRSRVFSRQNLPETDVSTSMPSKQIRWWELRKGTQRSETDT